MGQRGGLEVSKNQGRSAGGQKDWNEEAVLASGAGSKEGKALH